MAEHARQRSAHAGTRPSVAHSPHVARSAVSVTDGAILKIKELIVSGTLQPGDRLSPEKELAAQLGLSRSSLREAVRALTLLGVLDSRQGDGTYVTSLSPDLLVGVLSYTVDLFQDRQLLELLEVRRVLEPAATAMAATRISDEELDGVRECLLRMETITDPTEFVAVDLEFHDRIVQAAGNSTLASLVRGFSQQTTRVRIWRLAAVAGVPESTRSQHQAIYRALADHDPQMALAAETVHVAESELWLKQHLEGDAESDLDQN
jgi:GntR family transcriptional repressor for pyruvate dehydrogenase complex